jgi:hypothetical protein
MQSAMVTGGRDPQSPAFWICWAVKEPQEPRQLFGEAAEQGPAASCVVLPALHALSGRSGLSRRPAWNMSWARAVRLDAIY